MIIFMRQYLKRLLNVTTGTRRRAGLLAIIGVFLGIHIADASAIVSGLNWVLYYIGVGFGLLGVAGTLLFVYIVDADTTRAILDAQVIDVTWVLVRDLLNLSFILILLFSAFATIFHIERFHLRSILLRLVIMALLVNFSLPITKAIIDVFNIVMYFFLHSLFPQNGTGYEPVEIFGRSINIMDVFVPNFDAKTSSVTYTFFAVIFSFFYSISMVVIGVLFVIRLVALAILMVLSPIGFVASILPSTQGIASRYWNNLFKYAMAGPILVFTLFFSMTFMAYNHDIAFSKDSDIRITIPADTAATNAAQTSNIANIAFLAIPVIILWSGIITSSAMSDAASGMVTGAARNTVRRLRGMAAKDRKLIANMARKIPGAALVVGTARSFKVSAQRRRERFERKANRHAQVLSAQFAIVERERAKAEAFANAVASFSKSMEHLSPSQLRRVLNSKKSRHERAAAAMELAKRGRLTATDIATTTRAIGNGAETAAYRFQLKGEINRQKRRGTLVEYSYNTGQDLELDDENNIIVVAPEDAAALHMDISPQEMAKQQGLGEVRNSAKVMQRYLDEQFFDNQDALREVFRNTEQDNHNQLERLSDVYRQYSNNQPRPGNK